MGEDRESRWRESYGLTTCDPQSVPADSNLISFCRLCRSAIDHHRHSTNSGQCAIGAGGQFGGDGNRHTLKQLVYLHFLMPLQLQNRWRKDTHHYVRWSNDSRQVIRLYKPRLQQQLVLSPRCGHLKGNGGVKAAVRFVQSAMAAQLWKAERPRSALVTCLAQLDRCALPLNCDPGDYFLAHLDR